MRKYATSISFVIAFLLSVSIFAQDQLGAKLPFDAKVTTGKLDNGLTYYIREISKRMILFLICKALELNSETT